MDVRRRQVRLPDADSCARCALPAWRPGVPSWSWRRDGGRGCDLARRRTGDKPLLIVLVAASGAYRRSLRGQDARRLEVVATHPAFVLGMVFLGPGADAGHRRARRSSPTRPPRGPDGRQRGGLRRLPRRRVAAGPRQPATISASSQSSAWFALGVVGLFVATWALNVILIAATCAWLAGWRIERQLAATWRPLLSANLALACATAVLVYLVATVGAAVIALSGVILIAYSRLQRDLLQAERHAEAARQARRRRPGRSATASCGSSSTSSTLAIR